MSKQKEKSSIGGFGFALGLIVGTLAGAAAAVLLAPQSGQETRQLLADRARELRHRKRNGKSAAAADGLGSEGVTIL
ncbi:MAG: YtxH domain-containing protein [Vulcanimicrobiota bacterium]